MSDILYDSSADVIRKALRGLAMAPSVAAARAGLAEREVIGASRGPAPSGLLRQLAPALGLDPEALAGLPDYRPPAHDHDRVTRLELPFDDETVNAWCVNVGGGEAILFDTGDGPTDALRALRNLGKFRRVYVFITHVHGDHVGGLREILAAGIATETRGPGTAMPLLAGDEVPIRDFKIRCLSLPGHCDGALGYVVSQESDDRPALCVTGDALFAGSIGGCAGGEPFQAALRAIRSEVMTLDGATVILPGHGPASTVDSERAANAFVGQGNSGRG